MDAQTDGRTDEGDCITSRAVDKNRKIAISPQRIDDVDEICHGDASRASGLHQPIRFINFYWYFVSRHKKRCDPLIRVGLPSRGAALEFYVL